MKYRTEEMWSCNEGKKIYGRFYIPEGTGVFPLIVFSHELGKNTESGRPYAERLSEKGFAVYIFDFPGGSAPGIENQSDGSSFEMSVLTELSDLESILKTVKKKDFVNPQKVFLLGASQGGLVSIIAACRHPADISGIILMYPALSAKVDAGIEQYQCKEDVPSDVSLFGGWMHVGSRYIVDLWDIDFYRLLSTYTGKTLLLHGDKDRTVPLCYSEKAAELITDCEFHVIRNAKHAFSGDPFEEAVQYIIRFVERLSAN